MAESLAMLAAGPVQPTPQDLTVGETLAAAAAGVIPPELLAEVKRKLAAGRYRHYQ